MFSCKCILSEEKTRVFTVFALRPNETQEISANKNRLVQKYWDSTGPYLSP